jgi:cytidylate kinase
VKFYLDASPDVRARRRAEQMVAMGSAADLGTITAEILERDRSDSTRSDGPLMCPGNAICVDTSDLNFQQVVDTLHRHVLAVVGR